MTNLDYETDRLVEELKKFNQKLEEFNQLLREEISRNECTDSIKQNSDRT